MVPIPIPRLKGKPLIMRLGDGLGGGLGRIQGGGVKPPVFWEVKFIKKRISILPKILMPDRWR